MFSSSKLSSFDRIYLTQRIWTLPVILTSKTMQDWQTEIQVQQTNAQYQNPVYKTHTHTNIQWSIPQEQLQPLPSHRQSLHSISSSYLLRDNLCILYPVLTFSETICAFYIQFLPSHRQSLHSISSSYLLIDNLCILYPVLTFSQTVSAFYIQFIPSHRQSLHSISSSYLLIDSLCILYPVLTFS